MIKTRTVSPDPQLDLVLERVVDVPRELVWKAWTEPEHVMKWFTPAPWTVTECEIDLRPGGIFRTTMRSPEGRRLAVVWLRVLVSEFRHELGMLGGDTEGLLARLSVWETRATEASVRAADHGKK